MEVKNGPNLAFALFSIKSIAKLEIWVGAKKRGAMGAAPSGVIKPND